MQKFVNFICIFLTSVLVFSCASFEKPYEVIGAARGPQSVPVSPQCTDFIRFAVSNTNLENGFKTDQLIVWREGKQVYEWADGDYTLDSPHFLWSASKTITATIIGAAIQQGLKTPKGNPFSVETPITDFYPHEARLKQIKPNAYEHFYDQIKVKNFLNMSTNFKWDESYESDPIKSSFLPMLYGEGHNNMLAFALKQPMDPYGPGNRWNYSGGNSVMLMGMLRLMVGESNYHQAPRKLLFDKIEMPKAFYERDGQGNFVGSSYAHMSPREMLNVGILYLNNGVWKGQRILPEGWVDEAKMPTEAISTPGNLTPPAYVKQEGVWSKRGFWLNQDVEAVKMVHEFPDAPRDMYFAAGHYGQLIIILPSQKMVIVRTGHDQSYWGNINEFVKLSLGCFGG